MLKDKFGPLELKPPDQPPSHVRLARSPRLERVSDVHDHNTPFSRYFRILNRRKWIILSLVTILTAGTLFVCESLTPVFESTATIDIDLQAPHGIIGQDSQHPETMSDADQILATQVSLVESDSVLRPVAAKYNLLTLEGQQPKTAANSKYMAEAPIQLKRLKVKRSPNTYLMKISYRSSDRDLAASVANAVAGSYIDHTYVIRSQSSGKLSTFMEGQLGELRAKMERSSLALANFESELNVVNPEEKTSIVSARLLQLNTQYTDAQADRMRKEAFYNSTKTGSLESAQVSPQGEALVNLLQKENEAKVALSNVTQVYGPKHPEAKKANAEVAEIHHQIETTQASIRKRSEIDYQQSVNREQMLSRAVLESKAEFDRLNAHSFEYQQVRHEAEGDRKLYEDLVRKIREAGINAGFQNSAIRVADPARPSYKPVFPNTPMYVAIVFFLSTALVTGTVLLTGVIDNTVSDPDEVAKAFGARVLGTLPGVKSWKNQQPQILRAPDADEEPAFSTSVITTNTDATETVERYRESIRSLRTSILFDQSNRRIRVLLITSSMPGEGKSTAAAYLAASYTAQGKKVLLIDGDLRRPSLHRIFDISNTHGLTDVLLGRLQWRDARITTAQSPDLDVLPAGPPSRQACDLVERMTHMFEEAADEYDLIIVDSPPLLAFAEPIEMAPSVDGVVILTRAGETNRKALEEALSRLSEVRANVLGVIVNGFTSPHAASYLKHYRSSRPYAAA